MVTTADREMWPALQEIWRLSFGDGQDYTRFMFEEALRPDEVLVWADRDRFPLAMLCYRPALFCAGEERVKGAYVFGIATHPGARGRGLATKLLEKLHKRLERTGFALSLLVPAREELFHFYRKRGYYTGVSIKNLLVRKEDLLPAAQPCVLVPSQLHTFGQLRDAAHEGRGLYLAWDRPFLELISRETHLLGGEVLAVGGAGREGYVVCCPWKETVYVKELQAPALRLEDVLAALHARYGAERYQLRLPADYPTRRNAGCLPFAMVRWYDREKEAAPAGKRPGYVAHVFG